MASYSKSNVKLKRTVLSVEEKLNVCDMVRKKIPKTEVLLKYNTGKSTVNDICKSEERLKNFKMTKSELGISKSVKATKAMKIRMYHKLDSALICGFDNNVKRGFQ